MTKSKKDIKHIIFRCEESISKRKYYFSNAKLSSCITFNILAILYTCIIQRTKESKFSADNLQTTFRK